MRTRVTRTLLLGLLAATVLPAQQVQDVKPADSTHADSAHPLVPTPAQEKYLQGLKTAGRGVAQLKDGIGRVARYQSARDTTALRQAGKRLGGLCGAARSFLTQGRTQMSHMAWDPPIRTPARDLSARIDSLTAATRPCEQRAGKDPPGVSASLLQHVKSYELALAAFRTAIGLPNK